MYIERPSLQIHVLGLEEVGLAPTSRGINCRLGGVFRWLVLIFMEVVRD